VPGRTLFAVIIPPVVWGLRARVRTSAVHPTVSQFRNDDILTRDPSDGHEHIIKKGLKPTPVTSISWKHSKQRDVGG